MRFRNSLLGAAVGLWAIAAVLPAQATLREGMKVRITSITGPRITGVVHQVTPDSVFLFTEPVGARYGIARSTITQTQASEGRSVGRGAMKGLAWGVVSMAAAGGLILATTAKDENFETTYGDGDGRGAFLVNGVAGGAMFGALIGAFVKSEKWTDVSVQPMASRGGFGMRVGLSFR